MNVKTSRKMARADDRHQPPFCRRVAKPCKFLTMFMTHTKTIVNHRHANFFFHRHHARFCSTVIYAPDSSQTDEELQPAAQLTPALGLERKSFNGLEW